MSAGGSRPSDADRDTLAATVASDGEQTGEGASTAPLARGSTLGRYVVLGQLGAGGMGVVYAAYDPELDRRIAIKLLHAGLSGGTSGHRRFLREAQALAKLSHPNVVAIHDVGTHQGAVYLAMEVVEGTTVAAWLAHERRSWRAVLQVFAHAGAGLQAAHDKLLVHRDFKPENVMIGEDGRVRVMDLGLARSAGGVLEAARHGLVSDERLGDVTMDGRTVGTPRFMAPEQHLRLDVSAATDQFSFCVSLYHSLYGSWPFAGTSRAELIANVTQGNLTAAGRGSKVPAWIRPILVRGLSVDPEARWPSIAALLAALEHGQRRARRARFAAGFAGLAGLAAAAIGYRGFDHARRVSDCEQAGAAIAEVWNETARSRLHDALVATGSSHAHATANKVVPWLDRHAQTLASATTDACLNAQVDGTWSADMFDRATWCLDERRFELQALVDELSRADPQVLNLAIPAAAGLPDPGPCRDGQMLARLPAPPIGRRQDVVATRRELARAAALDRAGRMDDALAVGRRALAQANSVGWPRLIAAAHLRVGMELERLGAYPEAKSALQDAYFEAASAEATDVAADAAMELAAVVGHRLDRRDAGMLWSEHAGVALATLGDGEGLRTASQLSALAAVQRAAGAHRDEVASREHALAIRERALGPDHPDVAATLAALGQAYAGLARHAQAKAVLQRALSAFEHAYGPDHPQVARALSSLASVQRMLTEFDEARALHERALTIRERAFGPDHAEVGESLNGLAAVRENQGAYAEAKQLHQRALAIAEKTYGPEHRAVARSLGNLALVEEHLGAYDDARALHERALAIREKTLGRNHPDLLPSLEGLAEVALLQKLPAQAVVFAERAVEVGESSEAPPERVADVRFLLARALWAANADRPRALALARRTIDDYLPVEDVRPHEIESVRAWLAEHEGEAGAP